MDSNDITGWAVAVTNELVTDANCPEIETPEDINNGWCRCFAERVNYHLGDPDGVKIVEQLGHGCAHTWIEYNGRAYDSEAPEGVDDWRDLPFNQRRPSMQQTGGMQGGPVEVGA